MPMYEYKCKDCGAVIETIAKVDDPAPTCTESICATSGKPRPCGGETQKLISKSDFHLKGGGWAVDGY